MSLNNDRLKRKNIVITILSVVVVIESFLLFSQRSPKITIVETSAQSSPVDTTPPKGYITIILDDWGYNRTLCSQLADIESPVAVSILPNLAHSKNIANCAHQARKEVMLHLPLEPHQYQEEYDQDYIIKTDMAPNQIKNLVSNALDSLPYIIGVNNHMGSKATEDKRVMKVIFDNLKKRKLLFVDSLVTPDSICSQTAKEIKIAFAQRDIFLDNKNERTYIENQFRELAQLAEKKGAVVAIGHARSLTLEIVKEQTQWLENQGFKIISIKDHIKLR